MIMIYLICFLFILFLIWTYNMYKGNFKNIDNKFYNMIKINNLLTGIFKVITNLASSKFLVLILIVLLLASENKKLVLIWGLCIIINSGLIGLIKHIFKRPRPNINRLVNERGYSYPSGHTMCATSFYGFIIFLVIISSLLMPLKIFFIVMLVLLILLVGFSRIYLGVHYLSDVIGGLLVSSSYILLFVYLGHFILKVI